MFRRICPCCGGIAQVHVATSRQNHSKGSQTLLEPNLQPDRLSWAFGGAPLPPKVVFGASANPSSSAHTPTTSGTKGTCTPLMTEHRSEAQAEEDEKVDTDSGLSDISSSMFDEQDEADALEVERQLRYARQAEHWRSVLKYAVDQGWNGDGGSGQRGRAETKRSVLTELIQAWEENLMRARRNLKKLAKMQMDWEKKATKFRKDLVSVCKDYANQEEQLQRYWDCNLSRIS